MRIRANQLAGFAAVSALAVSFTWAVTAQQNRAGVPIDSDDIGGVVTSSKGPEAGVWVIAESTNLPTKLARVVVTDDQGRYVVPDLPQGSYQVFVRGYGLVDSPRQLAKPGQQLNLNAQLAPDAKSAAQVYPAAWWFSMISLPQEPERQLKFHQTMKLCYDCHQMGNKATREFAPYVQGATSLEKWETRTKYGPSGPSMFARFQQLGEDRGILADWTDRIARGEAPQQTPPRPAGIERNLVISLWDWGLPIEGRSDDAASDIRNPTVNANGMVYSVSQMNDMLNILDPIENKATSVKIPTAAPVFVSGFSAALNESPNFGPDIWRRQGDPRSIGIDAKGRAWFTLRTRDPQKPPAFCSGPGANKFGRYFPMKQSGKQVALYDPKTQKFDYVDTCFNVDHNEFGKDNFIYYGTTGSVGWVDTGMWDKTHDAERSQGWCPAVVDTNGDGKISAGWTEPDQPIDPSKDHRITFGCYSITVNPKDGSLWCSGIGEEDKRIVRIEKGPNPPETCRAEVYEPPIGQKLELIGTGGILADSNGLVYDAWRVSGHFTVFDRSKCKTTKDPKASGQSCPEGWTIYRNTNEPHYGNSPYKASAAYLAHMDAHDTLFLGKESPMYASPNTDSMEVFSSNTKEFVTLRVPYPLGFFVRSGTGRIDNPNTGWKGRGFWSSYSTFAAWHIEGGKGTRPKSVKFQMRPNPLAK